ncbi:hypothetical protein ACFYV7_17420 [Nocardia suismassiliense]|uniref:Uncharacterized protein n=1 Tax=Nocardia suismassiliense TaxID=2077092 RepID=A0ABW6QTL4_9NOCA
MTVLSCFYDFAIDADLGPLMNPVPARQSRGGGRLHARHNPMDPFQPARRARYRQKLPTQTQNLVNRYLSVNGAWA